MVTFFPPPVEKVHSTSPLPVIAIPFAIPPSFSLMSFMTPTKSDTHGEIARLAPESIMMEKEDLVGQSSKECGIPPRSRDKQALGEGRLDC